MGAIDKLITRNLSKLDELLKYAERPVGSDAYSAAREAISRGTDPVWAQAQAKGLPLTDEAIEARARAMGFDRKAYHGTTHLNTERDDYPPEFDELMARSLPDVPDEMAGTISTYLGPHVARDPGMSFPFAHYSPERLAGVISSYGPHELSPGVIGELSGHWVNKMTRDEIEHAYRLARDRDRFNQALEIETGGYGSQGRIIPLRLRGGVHDLDQRPIRSDEELMHDDQAVDVDVATHALLNDPSWYQAQRIPGERVGVLGVQDRLGAMIDRILSRGNPRPAMRDLVARNVDLRPQKLAGAGDWDADPAEVNQLLERMMDDYRADHIRQGTPILRYKNTMGTETEYAPSHDAYIVLDPTAVRAESAIFDPDLRHLSGLGYAGGGQVGKLARIVAAALKASDGTIAAGTHHGNALEKMIEKGYRNQPFQDGYLTEAGEFLTRAEGLERSRAISQIEADPEDWANEANQLADIVNKYAE